MHMFKKIIITLCMIQVVCCLEPQELFAAQKGASSVTLEKEFCARLKNIQSSDVEGVVREYCDRGLDLRKVAGRFGNNVLHEMCYAQLSRDVFLSSITELVQRNKALVQKALNAYNDQGCTPLHDSILRGDVEKIEKFLGYGADVTVVTNEHSLFPGNTCLSLAVHIKDNAKRQQVLDVLWGHNEQWLRTVLHQCGTNGMMPIQHALLKGDVDGVSWLLDKGADITVLTDGKDLFPGSDCLSLALRIKDKARLCNVLWQHKEEWVREKLNRYSPCGLTPIHDALLKGDLAIVRWLLDKGADVTILTGENNLNPGRNSLCLALSIKDSDDQQQVLDVLWAHNEQWMRMILNQHGPNGLTPIHNALLRGDVTTVRWLLDKGADVTILTGREDLDPENNCLALALSIKDSASRQHVLDVLWGNNEQWVKMVLNRCASRGLTPIQYAVLIGDIASVRWLLDKGADVTVLTGQGDRFPGNNCLALSMCIKDASTRKEMLNLLAKKYKEKDALYKRLTRNEAGCTLQYLAQKFGRSAELDEAVAAATGCKNAVDYLATYEKNKKETELVDWTEAFTEMLSHDFRSLSVAHIKTMVQSCLDKGLDIKKARHDKGRNLVHVVCKSNLSEDKICAIINCFCVHDKDAVRELLAAYDNKGLTPFHTAVVRGMVSVVQYLMTIGADPTQVTGPEDKRPGENVLFLVFDIKDVIVRHDMLNVLVKALDERKVLKKHLTDVSHGRTVVDLARLCARRGKMLSAAITFDSLMARVDDDEVVEAVEESQPLYVLSSENYVPQLSLEQKFCLEMVNDVNDMDDDALSERVHQLLESGLDISRPALGQNLLHDLCSAKIPEEKCCVMLDAFFEYNQQVTQNALTKYSYKGLTPLHTAIVLGRVGIAKKFIKMGANVLSLTKRRENILHGALTIQDSATREKMLAMLVPLLHEKRCLFWCLQDSTTGMTVIKYSQEHGLCRELDEAVTLVHSFKGPGVAQDYVRKLEENAYYHGKTVGEDHAGWLLPGVEYVYCSLCQRTLYAITQKCNECGSCFTNISKDILG